jgi:hypothetical protein
VFGVRCSVFGVRCSVFGVRCSVFGVRCSVFDIEYRVSSIEYRVSSIEYRVSSIEFRVSVSSFGIEFRYRVSVSSFGIEFRYRYRYRCPNQRFAIHNAIQPQRGCVRQPGVATARRYPWIRIPQESEPCRGSVSIAGASGMPASPRRRLRRPIRAEVRRTVCPRDNTDGWHCNDRLWMTSVLATPPK